MKKIMFVCHGNICRSPMAEFIFKSLIEKNGFSEQFLVQSCATSTEEIGNPVYPPARTELKKYGISCDGKYSVQLRKNDYDNYDLFICMDSNNVRNANRIFDKDTDKKIHKLMEYTDKKGDVTDPWYTGDFDICYKDILAGCEGLLNMLIANI